MPSEAYLEELKDKKERIFSQAKHLAKPGCKHCNGKGIQTWIVGRVKNIRQEVHKLCQCVTKNLKRLESIKKGEFKEDGDFDLKKRVAKVPIKEFKKIKFEWEENVT